MKRGGRKREVKRKLHRKNKINQKTFLISFIAVLLFAFMGILLTYQNVGGTWYNLIKPSIAPPSWVFSVTWSILFVFIGLSLYFALVNAKDKRTERGIEIAFGVNFILGVSWSFFFFTLRKPLYAFFDLILLWASIIVLILLTERISRKSAWLLVPYLLWISFAGALNYLTIAG
jgi:tryptophan-rich sensory protein